MIDQATTAAPSSFTSDLTRKLVDDADLLSRFNDDRPTVNEEQQVLGDLIKDYDQLDLTTRQELVELASLLADEQGQALRAAICRPATAEIVADENGMLATCTLTPPAGGGKALSTADIISMLRERNIVFGVDLHAIAAAITELSRSQKKSLQLTVATGKEPINGEPGRIEFNITGDLPGNTPKSKRQQWMAKARDLLAQIIPPTPGTPGSNIYGQEVPAIPGPAAQLDTADGVSLNPERNAYLAAFDGLAIFDGKKLEMRHQFVWNGDLNIHDPVISFDGSVVIHGTVRDGVTLTATGDIEIHEGIEAASVISTSGSILVKQGITAHGRGYVSAKKSVDVKYIENGIVYCEEDILVRHAVLHSRLTAGHRVAVELGKGAIFGGEIRAGSTIVAKSFGNVAGVPTRLSVGHTWSSLRELQDCEALLATIRQNAALCETLITKFRHARPQLTTLSMAERQSLSSLIKRHIVLKARIRERQSHYEKLDSTWILEGSGEIKCHESLYPGVTVKIGDSTALVSQNHTACSLHLHPQEKRLIALSPSGKKSYL